MKPAGEPPNDEFDPHLLEDITGPITLVNFFALRERADYPDPSSPPCSGVEAMMRYSAVSADRLASVGGVFVVQGLHVGALWGDDDPWDVVVVANYPSPDALRDLLADEQYQVAFAHRRAAVARQRVSLCSTIR